MKIKTLLFYSSWALTLTSGLSYFFGLLRDRIFAHTFGLSRTLDIYNASFVIPDLLLNVLVGTALSAAFLPIYSRKYDEKKELGYAYAHQIMSWGLLIILAVGALAALALPLYAQWAVPGFEGEELKQYIFLTRLMMISPLLFTVSNIYGRILLGVKEFFWYGLSPALYNLGIVLGTLFLVPSLGIAGVVVGTLLGILMHLSVRWLMVRRSPYSFRDRVDFRLTPEVRETVRLMIPKMLQYFIWSYMLLQFTGIASTLSEGSIAAYNYARNFQSLPVSMLGIAIATALYTSLSHDAAKGNLQKFKQDFRRDRRRAIFYTVLAAIALAAISKPMIRALLAGGAFNLNQVDLLALTLQIYCFSIPLESLLHVYHRAYYSLLNTIIPSVFHALTMLGAIQLAKILAPDLGVLAIPIGFAGGLAVHVAILAVIFPVILKKRIRQSEITAHGLEDLM